MRLPWLIAVRLLRRRGSALLRTSAFAALAAVILGVASLVVVLALMSGYEQALRQGILAAGGHMVALFPAALDDAEVDRVTAEAMAVPGVTAAGPAVYLPGLLIAAGAEQGEAVTLKAAALAPPFVSAQALQGGTAPGPVPIALGRALARRLAVVPGQRLNLQLVASGRLPSTVAVAVAEVYHTGFAEADETFVVADLDTMRRRSSLPVNSLEIWVDDPQQVAAYEERVEDAIGNAALVTTWKENNLNLFAALRWQKISLAVVLSLVLGVGAFEVASALVVLVTEKRRELGVLLALGGQPALIRRTLVLAGGLLGCAGVLGGVVLGTGLVGLLDALRLPRFPAEIAEVYMVDRIPLAISAGDLLVVLALGAAEVLLASLLPAARAASREPVEVLRWV